MGDRVDEVDAVVVGAGLSGLVCADLIHQVMPQARVLVLEAADAVGGRTRNTEWDAIDVGGAWMWPHANPHLLALAERLGVTSFPQPGDGDRTLDDVVGTRRVRAGDPQGWHRFDGGAFELSRRLASGLPEGAVRVASPVGAVRFAPGDERVELELRSGRLVRARAAVLAVPPRALASSVTFVPPLPPGRLSAMSRAPTWMASTAKFVATYDRPWWRGVGLSGTAVGDAPLGQVYDATAGEGCGGRAALCGFVFEPQWVRSLGTRDGVESLKQAALRQLVAAFGPDAGSPLSTTVHSWMHDPWTTPDPQNPSAHVRPRPDRALSEPHGPGGRVLFGSSETAGEHAGMLEGAVTSGQRAAREVLALLGHKPQVRYG